MERIRDASVAEQVAAAAGTDATPEFLALGEVVTPTIALVPRPALAVSGYEPGTISARIAASALNFGHVGILALDTGGVIVRVNWAMIQNITGGALTYRLRRLDSPLSGFTAAAAIPGYIDAGNPATGRVFQVERNDQPATIGVSMGRFTVEANSNMTILGPWILNAGALLVSSQVINQEVYASFGFEAFNAIRPQQAGG